MTWRHTTTLLFATLLVGTLCACGAARRAGSTPEGMTAPGVVLLVRTHRHIAMALKSAASLLSGPEVKVPVVEIVVCDKGVTTLSADPQLAASIAAARERGIHTQACGLSLERFGVPATTLPPGVDIVPNGVVETLRLQSLGYLSIEL
jgi:intracellular sulfur oxidation DsrE/DsrF family protein